MRPLAPGINCTTTGSPRYCGSTEVITRALRSCEPPAPSGMIMVIGLSGYLSWASADPLNPTAAATAAAVKARLESSDICRSSLSRVLRKILALGISSNGAACVGGARYSTASGSGPPTGSDFLSLRVRYHISQVSTGVARMMPSASGRSITT